MNYNGSRDEKGIHYDESYASGASPEAFRIMLTVAGNEGLEVSQLDIEAAFTNGDLSKENNCEQLQGLYMEQDQYFQEDPTKPRADYVCELLMALFGTKQGARIWRECVHAHMIEEKMTPSEVMDCVYFGMKLDAPYDPEREHLRGLRSTTVITDDFAIAHGMDEVSRKNYEAFVGRFLAKYAGTDMGSIGTYCSLSMEKRADGVYTIDHEKYIEGMLERQGLSEVEEQDAPYSVKEMKEINRCTGTDEEDKLGAHVELTDYRSVIGALLYPARNSTPVASATVGILAQFAREGHVRESHMKATRHLAGYLKKAKADRMVMHPGDMKIRAGADASFATCKRTRRSRTGGWIKLGNALIAWTSQMQSNVSRSPAEAEIRAASDVTVEIEWLKMAVEEYGYDQGKIGLECDCDPAITIINGNGPISTVRNIDVQGRHAQQARRKGIIEMIGVSTHDNQADLFTKAMLSEGTVARYKEELIGGMDQGR